MRIHYAVDNWNPQRPVQLSLFIMTSALELLHRCERLCAYMCICVSNQFSSYLSVVCRAMLCRSFSSLTFVCRHFRSSVSFLTTCSAFQRLSLSWSRSSTIVWHMHIDKNTNTKGWTIKQHWMFFEVSMSSCKEYYKNKGELHWFYTPKCVYRSFERLLHMSNKVV